MARTVRVSPYISRGHERGPPRELNIDDIRAIEFYESATKPYVVVRLKGQSVNLIVAPDDAKRIQRAMNPGFWRSGVFWAAVAALAAVGGFVLALLVRA